MVTKRSRDSMPSHVARITDRGLHHRLAVRRDRHCANCRRRLPCRDRRAKRSNRIRGFSTTGWVDRALEARLGERPGRSRGSRPHRRRLRRMTGSLIPRSRPSSRRCPTRASSSTAQGLQPGHRIRVNARDVRGSWRDSRYPSRRAFAGV
jgi:hypothetical protein